MDLYGLLGYPLGHSFSAKYFAKKFERDGIAAEYRNFEYPTIEEAMQALMAQPNLRGFNVTIPYKEQVIPYLSELAPEAKEIGAVNAVRVLRQKKSGKYKLVGYNTDMIGFLGSLFPLLRPEHHAALVLGTGGASKAVVFGLQSLGIETVCVSRTAGKGRLSYTDLTPEVMKRHLIIVNCTPVGMHPHADECPAIPYDLLGPEHLLYDLIYNPLETLFMQKGQAQGATVKNGLDMLLLQAEAGWQLWQE